MVGKGDAKGSRIFHQCYVKCCKLQNLTPLSAVIPSGNGKVLDFCVDRIKYVEWPPILNALCCDLSLHSVAIRCRQQVKTVLEHIDCERLAKTVNKRAVILTNFMLSNVLEAICQLLNNTTLLATLLLEGLPLKIPYLNPICEALLANNSLRHVFLPRCLVGDAGCLAICKAARCLPNILTLDLSGCEVTPLGASYIADLLKYQKIHRYSENWVHTLRYRMPELDTMAGLRRISLCSNPLGDAGSAALLSVLADDLWIKAVDLQNCDLSEKTATTVLTMMESNTTLVVLDLRHNDVSADSLAKVRGALRRNEAGGGVAQCYSWMSSVSVSSGDIRSVKPINSRNGVNKDPATLASRNASTKYPSNKTGTTKKEKEYAEILEEQLNEEISHRRQLEELNLQLVEQMQQLKQQQIQQWANAAASSGSEQSFQASSSSGERSSSSGSSCSVPIDQNTLSYIQQAFRDIYSFIKNNQCSGECQHERPVRERAVGAEPIVEVPEKEEILTDMHINIIPKKAQSAHIKLAENRTVKKITKSAHLLGQIQHLRESMMIKPEMFEKNMGDVIRRDDEQCLDERSDSPKRTKKQGSPISRGSCSSVSDSSDTLVSAHAPRRAGKKPEPAREAAARDASRPSSDPSPRRRRSGINPRDALYSSSDDESS